MIKTEVNVKITKCVDFIVVYIEFIKIDAYNFKKPCCLGGQ